MVGKRSPAFAVAAVSVLLGAGCATATGPRSSPKLSDPGPLAERWRLPSAIVDGATGLRVSEEALLARLLEARVVYVAEKHDRPHDHAVQAWVVHGLHQLDPSLGIGMEMFKRPFQRWVTEYVEGRLSEAQMLQKTEWERRWGFDFTLYRPILEYARQHTLPVYALNARDELTRQVAHKGLASLDADARAAVPELDLEVASHRARIGAVFAEHGLEHGSMEFENFYTAQVIWDETMAQEVAEGLSAATAPKRLVVLAGSGHISHADGIPLRAARRGAEPFVTIFPLIANGDPKAVQDLVGTGAADFLWVMLPPKDLPAVETVQVELR